MNNTNTKKYDEGEVKEKIFSLGITNSIELLKKNNREKVLTTINNSELKSLLGIKQLRKREINFNHWVLLSEKIGFNFNSDMITYITHIGKSSVLLLSEVRDKKGDKTSLFNYIVDNKENLNLESYKKKGISLNEILLSDIVKNYLSTKKITPIKGFENTRPGKLAMSIVMGNFIPKSQSGEYKKKFSNINLKQFLINQKNDILFDNNIINGLTLLKKPTTFREKNIGINRIKNTLGNPIKLRNFTTKYKIQFIENSGYNIKKEIAQEIYKSPNLIESINGLGLGKYTVYYLCNRYSDINKYLTKDNGTTIIKLVKKYIDCNDFKVNHKNRETNESTIIVSLVIGRKVIRNNSTILKQDISDYNKLLNFPHN